MKKGIHPQFYMTVYTDISSGKKFTIGSTIEEASIEISSDSHPFYTGEERIIDIENRVDTFERKKSSAGELKGKVAKKKAKMVARKNQRVSSVTAGKTVTLKDMLKNMN